MRATAESLRAAGKMSWRLNVRPSNAAALALYNAVGLRTKYLAKSLRLPWTALSAFPPGNAVVESLTPERDAQFEQAFDIPRGQLAATRDGGRLLFAATSRRRDQPVGLAAFDPKFPGAFPFRVADANAVAPLLNAMRQHVPEDEYVNLVAEDDEELIDLLTSAGASTRDKSLHLEGVL